MKSLSVLLFVPLHVTHILTGCFKVFLFVLLFNCFTVCLSMVITFMLFESEDVSVT